MIRKRQTGFTLIELLIVISIIGVLAVASSGLFFTSLQRGRDARRKGDLATIQKALEAYYNDRGSYPTGSPSSTNTRLCSTASGFDTAANCSAGGVTVYLAKVPIDPNGTQYCYAVSGAGNQIFRLYSILDNTNDTGTGTGSYSCGGNAYNYGVSSTNATP